MMHPGKPKTAMSWHRQLPYVLLIIILVPILVMMLPSYSDTIRRFLNLPPVPSVPVEPKKAEEAMTWAQEVLRTGHNLVYYIWVVGAVLVGAFAAIAYYFFTWWNEHRELIRSIASWQDAVRKSERLVLEAVERLPVDVFLDFRSPAVYERFRQAIDDLLPYISPEEIDIQIANTALLIDVPADVYRRLGNYFRFRAYTARIDGKFELRGRDLWYAIRRYQRARDSALSQGGKSGKSTFAHATHGIAICLLLLERNREAIDYAKVAADELGASMALWEAVPAIMSYGLALKRCNRFVEAVEVFASALDRAPFDVRVNYNLACCRAKWGDSESSPDAKYVHYLKACEGLERIRDRLGTDAHVVNGIHTDRDFEGLRGHHALATRFQSVADQLKTPP